MVVRRSYLVCAACAAAVLLLLARLPPPRASPPHTPTHLLQLQLQTHEASASAKLQVITSVDSSLPASASSSPAAIISSSSSNNNNMRSESNNVRSDTNNSSIVSNNVTSSRPAPSAHSSKATPTDVKDRVILTKVTLKPWFSARDYSSCNLMMALNEVDGGDSNCHTHPTDQIDILRDELYVSGHSIVHPELCSNLGSHLRLLVLVTSAPSHSKAREAVRLTWGHFGSRADVAIAFLLGQPPDELAKSIQEEDALYGDIIMGKFIDTYSNLTLKTLSMLEWVNTYCPRVPRVMKTDDDMFINVPKLLAFLSSNNRPNATKTIWGKVLKKAYPMRIPKSKYYLSRTQFGGRVLPAFATGPAYVLTADCVPILLDIAPNSPYVRLEDVFVTGILADKAKLKRMHAHEFYNKKVSAHPCAIQRGVAIHMVRYHEQFDMWRKLLDGKTKCS